jgi:alanine dehydrogenase
MKFGIPKEADYGRGFIERRVALSPAGVRELWAQGGQVFVEKGAGEGAGFRDEEYMAAGAQIVYSREEVYARPEVILRISRPSEAEWPFLPESTTLMAFLHLAVGPQGLIHTLVKQGITTIGLEAIREEDGDYPIQKISSQIAGRMAPQIASRLLEAASGGMGILLSGLPGIPPADVVILGGGTLGREATRAFLGLGASVYVLDVDTRRLEEIDRRFGGRVVTALATRNNLEKFTAFAEVLIGAVRVPEGTMPLLVTRDMVRKMHQGAVILDFSINEGGCVETSRLTPREDFVFIRDGVVHFAVPNVPSAVPRTATYALTQALLPYLRLIQREGINGALRQSTALRQGTCIFSGHITHPHVSRDSSLPLRRVEELLEQE